MTTVDLKPYNDLVVDKRTVAKPDADENLLGALPVLGSLRITVVLFALSLVLVFAGTTAQRYYDVWHVVHEYFRTWVAWIDIRDFLPSNDALRSETTHLQFPFPGGYALGAALSINLLAAHAFRFKLTAKGNRLWAGLALVAAGCVTTYVVIQSGLDDTIESELPEQFNRNLWFGMKAALGGASLLAVYWLAVTYRHLNQGAAAWAWRLSAVAGVLLASFTLWLFLNPEAALRASDIGILWQLAKATMASLVLYAGCWLLFSKRAGIVLLHGGIGLMMFSELLTGLTAVETHMRLIQGETASHAEDMRSVELAIVEQSGKQTEQEVVVPLKLLAAAAKSHETVSDNSLPFDLRVEAVYPNSSMRLRQPGEKSLANAGIGELYKLDKLTASTGVDMNQQFDAPGAYVELLEKSSGNSIGTYLLFPAARPNVINLDNDKSYEVSYRFKPYDKPYSLTLLDFEHTKYVGTDKAKSFRSLVRLDDEEFDVHRDVSISMNNPLRYRGDTVYQSSYDPNNPEYTDLQVVTNTGWMIPYVACMIVVVGMAVHFGGAVLRFVRRRKELGQRAAAAAGTSSSIDIENSDIEHSGGVLANWNSPRVYVPALIVLFSAVWVAGRVRPPEIPVTKMQIGKFAQLPVAYGGRIQPLDTLARNTLRSISLSEELKLVEPTSEELESEDSKGEKPKPDKSKDSAFAGMFGAKKIPAIQWMLDTVTQSNGWRDYRCIRIKSLDILGQLGLERRSGFLYSISELLTKNDNEVAEYDRMVSEARAAARAAKTSGIPLDGTQTQILELAQRVDQILVLSDSFTVPEINQRTLMLAGQRFPAARTPVERLDAVFKTLGLQARINQLAERQAPRPIPPENPDDAWSLMLDAGRRDIVKSMMTREGEAPDHAASLFQAILQAYHNNEAAEFNSALADYDALLKTRAEAEHTYEAKLAAEGKTGRKPAERLSLDRLRFEALFNHASPFVLCAALYIFAFVLAALGLLGWSEGFNRSANWLLWFTFAVHTIALICRIYISGRPPVTNLYSSAVFIGWAGVLFSLLFEMIYRLGIGNLLAGLIGFPTLLIAYFLSGDGDTFTVMQAVLDTQFWLATHVVCITFGYATTFLAGTLGATYLVLTRFTNKLDANARRDLTRMTYGALCFSILFSFFGTVLGGLWADASWGRFWGWDPKENGALMIVIWNALVLHARWGKLVGERGLAVLAVLGNIVVSWSWFGVNLMGVGLHSYGFKEGPAFWLGLFVLSQLVIATLACISIRGERSQLRTG